MDPPVQKSKKRVIVPEATLTKSIAELRELLKEWKSQQALPEGKQLILTLHQRAILELSDSAKSNKTARYLFCDIMTDMSFYYMSVKELRLPMVLLQAALALNPSDFSSHIAMAMLLNQMEKPSEAIERYQLVLQLFPPKITYRYVIKMAEIEERRGNIDAALRYYERSVKYSPNNVAHRRIAEIFFQRNQLSDALSHINSSLEISDNSVSSHVVKANILRRMNDLQGAQLCYLKAAAIDKTLALPYDHIARMKLNMKDISGAVRAYQLSLRIKPNSVVAQMELDYCKKVICDWDDYDEQMDKFVDLITRKTQVETDVTSIAPYIVHLCDLSLSQMKSVANPFTQPTGSQLKAIRLDPHKHPLPKKSFKGRLKIGYLGDKSVDLLIRSVVKSHSQEDFEIFHFQFHPNMTSLSVADRIFAAGIQILVVTGEINPKLSEIYFLRPAPIQVIWLNSKGTSGSSVIDYLVTDKMASPLGLADGYCEKFAYTTSCSFVGDHLKLNNEAKLKLANKTKLIQRSNSRVAKNLLKRRNATRRKLNRQRFGLPSNDSAVIFCCFNDFSSINPFTFDVWCEILRRVPNGILWLQRHNVEGEKNLRMAASERQIDPNRLIFIDPSKLRTKDNRIQMQVAKLAHVCLDTPLANNFASNLDLLWAGVPIVTQPFTSASRISASQLSALCCDDLITKSPRQYVNVAVRLATEPHRWLRIHNRLRRNRLNSPLFDIRQHCQQLEVLYRKMWKLREMGETPEHLV